MGHAWWLRGDEASELVMSSIFKHNLKVSLETLHPGLHEMHILEHDPVTDFTGLLESLDSKVFLTLSHGDVDEGSISNGLSLSLGNFLDLWGWIDTREKNEEDWGSRVHFFEGMMNIEGWLLNIFNTHVLSDELLEGIGKSIWSQSSKEDDSMEETDVLHSSWKINDLSLLLLVPLSPLKGLTFH